MSTKTYDEASSVEAENGIVFMDGPDGVAVAMTPAAAADTSDRLLHAANAAEGQRLEQLRLDEEQAARRTG